MKIIDMFVCIDDGDLSIITRMMTEQDLKVLLQREIDKVTEKKINELVDNYTTTDEEEVAG